jgi:hypothetical protein
MIIDHLPTGSVFSFLWNLMVSISFQFVGFLLTYLLHTTHAARFGSRAGLGVTLIQYGFALRSRPEDDLNGNGWWVVGGGGPYGNGVQGDVPSKPSFGTKEEAEEYYRKMNITMIDGMPTGTIPGATLDNINFVNEATTDWLSFFLMTIGGCRFLTRRVALIFCFFLLVGWFILITSLLSFWRVKRLERGILASRHETTVSARDAAAASSSSGQSLTLSAQLHGMVGLPIRDVGSLLRTGLGFSRRSHEDPQDSERHGDIAEGGRAVPLTPMTPRTTDETSRRELVIEMWAHDPDRQRQIIQAFRDDDQLMSDMRDAGML